ncbi:TonB-dependent receptor [Aliiglaciecola sp. CAU 1673]|uniref:TonB-dependent receptor plug domain-containing protein n=1 Tax=Aliiglaciecola sp. CAU 1673 TaxID=3032595 RepID=UPI0023DA31E3|nr:TonB-dependent receptor [Aliiglaciecola sp. CAU 1673]MDF2179854.1 TonB-dependent receptor [Aliiglaciecola sp. CAU 1673]
MPTHITRLSRSIKLALTTAATAGLIISTQASAQEESEAPKADAAVEKIAIVGTRAAPRSVGNSPVPVDIIGGEEFENQGSTDMISMLQTVVPSLNVNEQPINDASTLVRPANLRGMASDHTLVLVNGKRRHRSAVITFLGGGLSDGAQGPDVSVIPAIAIKQVEVLRDGAAAQYGSDAIAGVVNFALKNDDNGGTLEARYGSYYEGDGDTFQVAGNIGLPLSDDGFANFSMEYKEADPTSRSVQRDDAAALIAGGNSAVPQPVAQVWGNPEFKYDFKFFGNFGLDLGNDKEAYMFVNWAEKEVEGGFYYRNPHNRGGVNDGGIDEFGNQLLLVGDLTGDMSGNCPTDILVGDNVLQNPRYINEVANNPNCWAFNEMFPGGFTPKFGGVLTDASFVAGTKGDMGNEWLYDASVSIGQNEVDFFIRNTINPSLGPDTPTEFNPGKYIQSEKRANFDVSKYFEMDAIEGMNFAAGFEYGHESYESIAGDPKSYERGILGLQGFGIGSNGFPGLAPKFQGKDSRHSVALYVDTEFNINEDLLLGAAIRYEDFSDFGNTTKGKLSARWQVTESWALRGALASGFKAPTIGQSNVRNVTTAFANVNGETKLVDRATLPPTDPIAVQKGAEPLQPEESTSYSLGLVGELDNGLFLTIDYYNIELKDRISTASGITLTQADIDALLAQGVTDASSFSQVSFFTNDFDTTTQGVDIVANYSQEMFGGDTKYSLAYNWTRTEVDDAGDTVSPDRVRMLEDNLPPVRYSFTANHTNGDWRVLGRLSYFGSIFEDHLDSGLPIDHIGSEFTVDVEVGYHFTENFNVVVGAKNLLDEYPDRNTQWDTEVAGAQYPVTSPIGINGGFYYVRGVYSF